MRHDASGGAAAALARAQVLLAGDGGSRVRLCLPGGGAGGSAVRCPGQPLDGAHRVLRLVRCIVCHSGGINWRQDCLILIFFIFRFIGAA
mmetsp:Transcript_24707/g.41776  ORF Transcript_24707/g.41776 Transcript_24707/m.41776 type:complete len:90 (+) Transcript_24707:714-983(+)